jgi:zinc protease
VIQLLIAAAIAAAAPRPMPEPLPSRPFQMPDAEEGRLSNGLVVRVVANHEVPLFEISLALPVGAWADPVGKEGLAGATFDLIDEGYGGRDAATIAGQLKRLGGSVGAGASADASSIRASGPVRNLGPILDLWSDAVQRSDLPAAEWSLVQERRRADQRLAAERVTVIADRVAGRLTWGERYDGRHATEATVAGLTLNDVAAFHRSYVVPDGALLLVGGDVTLSQILPLLESRLGGWKPTGTAPSFPEPTPRPPAPAALYVVDKPGSAQSVIQAILPVGRPGDPDWYEFLMGHTVVGGAFTARLNMNLREDKGYTYGARCGVDEGLGTAIWSCSASVATNVTGPALIELRKEIEQAVTTRPVTADELAFFQSYRLNSFQNGYERPSELLGKLVEIWRYGLPQDWLERYMPGVGAVTVESANKALLAHVRPDQIAYLVVGDQAVIGPSLVDLGLPIVPLDRDGNPRKDTP